jgi:Uma2 family endonuclease
MTTMRQMNEDLLYPSGDGKAMAENTEQYKWIVIIKENLEILFADIPDVFIAGDLLWYYQGRFSYLSSRRGKVFDFIGDGTKV